MNNIEERIQKQIDGLVREVVLIAQEAALATVSGAFAGGLLARNRARVSVCGKSSAPRRANAKKREPDELAALAEKLFAAISEKPGEAMSTLSKMVESSPNALIVPVKRLVDSDRIRAVGERNLRRYFPRAT